MAPKERYGRRGRWGGRGRGDVQLKDTADYEGGLGADRVGGDGADSIYSAYILSTAAEERTAWWDGERATMIGGSIEAKTGFPAG